MEKVEILIPKKSEFISCLRLTTSAISSVYNLGIDKIEDMKVIISEICTFFINSIKSDNEPFAIEYFLDDGIISIEVCDRNKESISENSKENSEMFFLIIDSLADKYEIDYENNRVAFQIKK